MSINNRQTLYHHAFDDTYEIIIGGPELVTLIRYRHNLDRNGEEVDYDDLPPAIQQAIYAKVKAHLNERSDPL